MPNPEEEFDEAEKFARWIYFEKRDEAVYPIMFFEIKEGAKLGIDIPPDKRRVAMPMMGWGDRDEKYNKDMENFIALLELESRDGGARIFNKKEEKQIKKGLKAFKRIFFRLWW